MSWWKRYTSDSVNRFLQFDQLRTNTLQTCLTGDSRGLTIIDTLAAKDPGFAELITKQKLNGIFSSPPYVGMIDYHEQHAYAYELFGFERMDALEIGPIA